MGRTVEMYASNDRYAIGTQNSVKILEPTKCHIGLANPSYRISDESFCRLPMKLTSVEAKYNVVALANFYIFGIGNKNYKSQNIL